MSNLLSDYLNDRIETVPLSGVVNGMIDYNDSDDEKEVSSESESDTERQEYVKKEWKSYFPEAQSEEMGGLTDIVDGHEESILGTDICEMLTVPRVFDKYKFDTYYKKELPIDSFREKILARINTNSVVIIHGPTGCGKTTQVPQYILDQCKEQKSPCNIIVTQPRRIAAINIAQRVCEERGWSLGSVCGYQVGLDKNVSEDVVLTYVTTEVLLQRLILQKNLNRFTHIIIDEVHERNKTLDFLLLIVRKYLYTNSPSVKVILMSATMEAEEFAHYFRSISRADPTQPLLPPILHVNKQSEYSTSIYYNEQFARAEICYNIDEPCITPEQYELASKLIIIFDNLDETDDLSGRAKVGSVLVFLPGFHEIEEMNRVLLATKTPHVEWEIIPLHSSLTSEHMVKAFEKPRTGVRKIILSTNIAESSVTVPHVNYVVDFCLTKIMTINESTKFSTLSLQWASHNNCIQRAGRVGRVANGRVYRLVPEAFYNNQMQANTIPELQRAPLENIILYMKLLDLNDTPKNVLSLALSPPNLKDVENCIWHLKEVGALLQTCRGKQSAADGDITFLGRVMGNLPIDIHLSKLIVLGHMFSCLDETIIMAAGCMTRNIFVSNFRDRFKCYRKQLVWADGSCSDFMIFLNLYNVWLKAKRENQFRTTHEEYVWCKTNFVNLKGLREWDILIKELHMRLKKLQIEKSMRVEHKVHLSAVEKPLVLKVIICGAFYPNYFVRSGEYGQVDSKEAVRILNGRDPRSTVYFTNMKLNQPGQIYVRQIKKLISAENNPNVQIGFDSQSQKVFVEFKNVRQPEPVTIDGRSYLVPVSGNVAVDVYESVRKRQLKVPFPLELLPDHKAWEFANSTKAKRELDLSAAEDDIHCFTSLNYSPLPPLDLEYMTVTVTHVEDAGHFYCQHWNDETRVLLEKIFYALNGPGVFLEPTEKLKIQSETYAAMFNQDGKFYRCKVLMTVPGPNSCAQVQFVDYGNVQRVPLNRLYLLPQVAECRIAPIAMCCRLSEVQPCVVLNPKALWDDNVNAIFRKKTEGILLNAKVYSVVDEIVHLELFLRNSTCSQSFNQWFVDEGYAQKCEESYLSKVDHDKRLQVLASENPNNLSKLLVSASTSQSYTDFEEPVFTETSEVVELKGPFSPLEMKVCGMVQATHNATVQVDGSSVNAVLLDDNPEDPHARLLVAGQVTQSANSRNIRISQTTIMPSIPGLPMLMTMLFCPKMEPKPTEDGFRIASILCGLGCKEFSEKANFPMHDISFVLDTELTSDIIAKVNALRYNMNRAIKTMNNIYDELAYPDELAAIQKKLKSLLFDLLHIRQKSTDRVIVKHADIWNKQLADLEILRIDMKDVEDYIWPLLWFVQLNTDRNARVAINKNLDELIQIAKRLIPEKDIQCELCSSDVLKYVSSVRIHLLSSEHKANLAKLK